MIKVTAYIPHYDSGILESAIAHCTWVAGGSTMYTAIGRYHRPDAMHRLDATESVISVVTWLVPAGKVLTFKTGIDDIVAELHRLGEDSVLIEDVEVTGQFL